MKRALHLFIGLIALLASGIASAAEWKVIYVDEERVIHIDTSSISTSWGGIKKAWFTTHFFNDQLTPDKKPFNRSTVLWYFKCSKNQLAIRNSVQKYRSMKDNKVVSSFKYEPTDADYSDVVPESIGEDMFKAACSRN